MKFETLHFSIDFALQKQKVQVEKVTVERQPKSLWDFECSFEELRAQQHALLVLHKVTMVGWSWQVAMESP